MLQVIIERGITFLQTPEGEKIPRLVETVVRQYLSEPGACRFRMIVNTAGACLYNERTRSVVTPHGCTLSDLRVRVIRYEPAKTELDAAYLICECHVSFPYPTEHLKHFAEPAKTTAAT